MFRHDVHELPLRRVPLMPDRNSNRKQTRRIVFAAALSALSFVMLFIGAATSVLDLTMVVACAFCSVLAVIELRSPFPVLIWIVTGLLSLLLLPDKFVAIEYILFGGLYPIIKNLIERIKNKLVGWVLKLIYFNASLTAAIAVAKFVMNLPDDYGMTFSAWVYIFGNIFFVMSDLALSILITVYILKLRSRLRIDKFI